MASTDATPIPIKNQAYRVTFPILDADGDLVTAAGALDSEISKDAGTFADCTNEATEIATGSGMYYLDLTATEMNADTVALIIKSTGGKTTPMVLYPQTNGLDRAVNVTHWNGTAVPTPDTAGYPKVTIKSGTGPGEVSLASGLVTLAGVTHTGAVIPTVSTLTGHTAQTGDSFALASGVEGFSALDALIDAIKAKTDNLPVDPADQSLIIAATDAITSSIGGLNDISTAQVLAEVNTALDTAIAELGVAAPTATPTLRTGLMLLYMLVRNQMKTQTSGTDAIEVYNDAGTLIAKKLITDDGSDYTEAKMTSG